MDDLKEGFSRLLNGPQPPLTPVGALVGALVGAGRRVERRRRATRIAGGVGVVAVALVTAATALPQPHRDAGDAGQAPAAPVVGPSPAQVHMRARTGAEALDVLAGRLPPGYRIRESPTGSDVAVFDADDVGTLKGDPKLAGLWTHHGVALVYHDDRGGELTVDLSTTRTAPPTGDLCRTKVYGDLDTSCRTIAASSADVRFGTGVLQEARCEYATRFALDGQVTITQCLTSRAFERPAGTGLAGQVFTPDQLAELAADPAFVA